MEDCGSRAHFEDVPVRICGHSENVRWEVPKKMDTGKSVKRKVERKVVNMSDEHCLWKYSHHCVIQISLKSPQLIKVRLIFWVDTVY